MARITEQEVMLKFDGLAISQALKYGSGLPWEDAVSIAREAFLTAMRRYNLGQKQRFEDYACEETRKELNCKKRRERASRRAEARLSLDMQVSHDNDGSTYADQFAIYTPDETKHDVNMFMDGLPDHERIALDRVMSGYDKRLDNRTRSILQRKALNYGFIV